MLCPNCRQGKIEAGSSCSFCGAIDTEISASVRGYYDEDGIRFITDDKKYAAWKRGQG